MQAYAGKVNNDINHDAYRPAAWRVDRYLDEEDDEDTFTALRSHRFVFNNDKGAVDAMARTEKADDYLVIIALHPAHVHKLTHHCSSISGTSAW